MDVKNSKLKKKKQKNGLTPSQKVLTFVMIVVWMLIFIGGIIVNSAPYREIVSSHSYASINDAEPTQQQPDIIIAWLMVIFFYTPTNILILCMCAGLLGALSRISKLHVRVGGEPDLASDKTNPLISGLLRGIFVYLILISGVLVINEEPFTNPSQIQYLRLAGLLSLLSFLLNYNPSRFRSFLARGLDKFESKIQTPK
jgi:hypothetical protein